MPKLELYYRPSCPYCSRVLGFMKQNNISLELKDINDEKNRQKLVEVGGMQQVPCLFIDGYPTYESKDIIEWLDKNVKGKV